MVTCLIAALEPASKRHRFLATTSAGADPVSVMPHFTMDQVGVGRTTKGSASNFSKHCESW